MTFGNGSTVATVTDCLINHSGRDVWALCKLPPVQGCPPTIDEMPEVTLRRLDYAIRERSQDPYDIAILWSVEENCYVLMGATDTNG